MFLSLLWFGASTNQWALTVKYCEASDLCRILLGFLEKLQKLKETEGLCVPLHPLGTGNKVSDRCSLTGLYAGHRVDVPSGMLI